MRLLLLIVVLALAQVPAPRSVAADTPAVIVIVHPDNPVTRLDKKFITNAFLKKRSRWGDDTAIKPVDLEPGSSVRKKFSKDVLGRSVSAVRRYWNQQVFSGRGVPPPELDSEEDVVRYVRKNRGAIGYVSEGVDLEGVKIVQVR
jgi:ABC-type phosphate transport system substrate-binding protein